MYAKKLGAVLLPIENNGSQAAKPTNGGIVLGVGVLVGVFVGVTVLVGVCDGVLVGVLVGVGVGVGVGQIPPLQNPLRFLDTPACPDAV